MKLTFFRGNNNFSLPAAGLFSRSRLRGTQSARLCTTAQVQVPAGLPGARLGRSSRESWPSNRGIAFRATTVAPTRPMPTPKTSFFPPFFTSATVFQVPQQSSKASQARYNSRASSFPLRDSHERCVCVWVRQHECVRLCQCRILHQ